MGIRLSERLPALVTLLLLSCAGGGDSGTPGGSTEGGPCPAVGENSKLYAGMPGLDPCGSLSSADVEGCLQVNGRPVVDCMAAPGATTGGMWQPASMCYCDACGNSRLETGEQCEGTMFAPNPDGSAVSCSSLLKGNFSGPLYCTPKCEIDTSMCTAGPIMTGGTTGG